MKVTIQVCDLCIGDQTIAVAVRHLEQDGTRYALDLCAPHDEVLERARQVVAEPEADDPPPEEPAKRRRRPRTPDTPHAEENRELRAWAKQVGVELAERGRIPEGVRQQFREWRWNESHPVPQNQPLTTLPSTPAPPADEHDEGRDFGFDTDAAMATYSD